MSINEFERQSPVTSEDCIASFIGALILALSLGCGGGKLGGAPLEPTAKGTPTGPALTVTIGSAGGSLVSADGTFTVTVPAGAVATATEFGIQPITNESPGGLGPAYRLTPHGPTFSKPVKLTSRYSQTEVSPEGLGIAFQDNSGVWWGKLDSAFDEATRTISASTTHFGDWVRFPLWKPPPHVARLKASESIKLEVIACVVESWVAPTAPLPGDELVAPLVRGRECGLSVLSAKWSVNGKPGGNDLLGTVATAGPVTTAATYNAPARSPTPNPVVVSGDLAWTAMNVTKTFHSAITVGGDSWEGEFTANLSLGSLGLPERITAHAVFKLDSASSQPSLEVYPVTEGTVTWSLSGTIANCTYTGGPFTAPMTPGDGAVKVVPGAPAHYTGRGATQINATVRVDCSNLSEVRPYVVAFPWFEMDPTATFVMTDTTTLSGTSSSPGSTWQWMIKRF
jgi:hypothetical protein